MLEIYNETIRDLLVPNSSSSYKSQQQKYEIFYSAAAKGHEVKGLKQVLVRSLPDIEALMKIGIENRAEGSTALNQHSSRSHCILGLSVISRNLSTGNETFAKMCLVDLAGRYEPLFLILFFPSSYSSSSPYSSSCRSTLVFYPPLSNKPLTFFSQSECLGKSEASGQMARETSFINKSLSALGDVLTALGQNQNHVPFRNSRLTHYLKDYLSKTPCSCPSSSCSLFLLDSSPTFPSSFSFFFLLLLTFTIITSSHPSSISSLFLNSFSSLLPFFQVVTPKCFFSSLWHPHHNH
jgi:hypothetical protein